MASQNRSIVQKKNGEFRGGRGFSRQELSKAGISPKEALKSGLPIDTRRRTVNDQNVKMIKAFLKASLSKQKKKTR